MNSTPQTERKDWIVDEIRLSADAKRYGVRMAQYPYHVIGRYSAECTVHGQDRFSWNIPAASLDNPRYDLSGVTLDERSA